VAWVEGSGLGRGKWPWQGAGGERGGSKRVEGQTSLDSGSGFDTLPLERNYLYTLDY
jgi:hypothetical protein